MQIIGGSSAPSHRTQFFSFRIQFRRKASASDIGAPSPKTGYPGSAPANVSEKEFFIQSAQNCDKNPPNSKGTDGLPAKQGLRLTPPRTRQTNVIDDTTSLYNAQRDRTNR